MLEEQKRGERDPELEVEEDIMLLNNRDNHWKDVVEENHKDKGEVHALRWEVYMKEKEDLTKREFLVVVPHPKGGNIVWTCVEDNAIE